ncbi:MAG: hypothetical protein R3F65_17205 [bacterium]
MIPLLALALCTSSALLTPPALPQRVPASTPAGATPAPLSPATMRSGRSAPSGEAASGPAASTASDAPAADAPAADTPAADAPATDAPAADAPPALDPAPPPPDRLDGFALSLYYEGPGPELRYEAMVDRAADAGAGALSVVVQWAQPDVTASELAPHPTETPADDDVRRIIRRARARGLTVMVFPILWVEKRALGEWRGTLRPADEARWWASYHRFILHYARLAAAEGAALYSVGSELASLEDRTDRWRALIADVRAIYPGRLLYSANWDHYREVTFWQHVDLIGLTGYYRLSADPDASVDDLAAAWTAIRETLLRWRLGVGRPLVFTELGYPSLDGAAHDPWDYTAPRALDHEEQRRCFAAFTRAWIDTPQLAGVFFWNAWGPTDGRNTWYTVWGKPAESEVRGWFRRRASLRAPAKVDGR